MTFRLPSFLSALLLGAIAGLAPAMAQDRSIVVASTTSTQDSGLFGYLLPIFKAQTAIEVKVIAQGTGQALDTARRGDADVVFVHARSQEEKFLAEGFGVKRFDVMYNDFVLIGPKGDPARVKGKDIETALKTIQTKAAPFVSRGDKSGTHSAELALWKQAGVDIAATKGPWYREIGQGMGAALNTAGAMNGYVLSDRGTWISFKNRGDLEIVVEGDKRLFNQYGVMLVNPEKYPSVKKQFGQAFVDWLISAEGQAAIAGYKIDGQQLFFPNAEKKGSGETPSSLRSAQLRTRQGRRGRVAKVSILGPPSPHDRTPAPAGFAHAARCGTRRVAARRCAGGPRRACACRCLGADRRGNAAAQGVSAARHCSRRRMGDARGRSRRRVILFAAAACETAGLG